MNSPDSSFSVVVNTNGRRDSLANTLRSLRFLDYPHFEVCVVLGPTEDGSRALVQSYGGAIKVADCPEHNLSMSRNIGIAMAAGQYVAFVDDDALPEAEWLRDLRAGYDNDHVAATGGVVYDHTGWKPQYLYSTANRLGNADWHRATPADDYNFPLSNNFPYLQGTNTSFRRDRLVEIGGFDEEIEFYLDETDVCCRLIDRGYHVRQLPNALVHHKFLPSHIRNEHKVTRNRYPVIKNKIYFSLVNNHGHYTMREVIEDARRFIDGHAADAEMHRAAGRLTHEDMERLWQDVDRAWERGLRAGLTRARRLLSPAAASAGQTGFREFSRPHPAEGRKVFCFLSQEFSRGRIGGIGTYTRNAASALAALGHHVHVLTRSDAGNTVDFEDDVWVHRLEVKRFPQPDAAHGVQVPAHIWNYAATMGEEAHRIDSKRPLTCIEAPIWDGEGIAAQLEGIFPTVLSLHTSLGIWLQTHADKAADAAYMRDFGHPMLGVERHLLRHSPGVHANSQAIVKMMSDVYDIALAPPRCQVIHHGLLDPSLLPRTEHPRPPGLRLLFVGRLEERKGIDVLMHAFAGLLRAFPEASLDVVGDADVPWFGPSKFHDVYRNWPIAAAIGPRAIFHGKVPDEALRGFLAQADAVVVPSRFESFGLIALEAFAFARPVIAARAGGLAEVVAHGTTGLLVEPGDVGSLLAALMHIAGDAALRDRLGRAGRAAFDAEFSSTRMATQLAAFLSSLQRTRVPPHEVQIAAGSARSAHLWADQQGLLLTPGSVLELPPRGGTLFLTFWRHPWSGCVRVRAGGHEVLADLHAATSGLHTLQIDNIGPGHAVQIERAGMRSEAAQGDEVIFYRASWREAAAAPEAATEPATKPPQAARRPRRSAAALAIGASLARKC